MSASLSPGYSASSPDYDLAHHKLDDTFQYVGELSDIYKFHKLLGSGIDGYVFKVTGGKEPVKKQPDKHAIKLLPYQSINPDTFREQYEMLELLKKNNQCKYLLCPSKIVIGTVSHTVLKQFHMKRFHIDKKLLVNDNDNIFYAIIMNLQNDTTLEECAMLNTSWGDIRKIYKQLLLAVQVLQRYGIAHRDLSPDNIFWDKKSKKITVADFGSACYFGDGKTCKILKVKKEYGHVDVYTKLRDCKLDTHGKLIIGIDKTENVSNRAWDKNDIFSVALTMSYVITSQSPIVTCVSETKSQSKFKLTWKKLPNDTPKDIRKVFEASTPQKLRNIPDIAKLINML